MQQTKMSEFVSQKQNQIIKKQQKQLQKLILDLNKAGLSLLTEGKFDQAIQYFKKSQKILEKERINNQNMKIIQLQGITYNNLACYYKKTKKPKVALIYLKKALQLQVYKLNNWTSIAGTHLNICAIYSYMKNHQQAANHAELAINFLNKVEFKQQDQCQQSKSYWNVHMLSYYNLAIEKQYLKQYEQSLKCYQRAKQIAKLSGKRNAAIIMSCDQSINRIEPILQSLRKKMIQIIKRKQQAQEKGHAQYIRRNKKNFSFTRNQNNTSHNQDRIKDYLKKIQAYNQTDTKQTGTRFRTRKIQNMSYKQENQSSNNLSRKYNSNASFNHSASYKSVNKPRNLRLMTENQLQDRTKHNRYERINQQS